MFVVFLPALNFRGNRSPYLWWFYKLLSAFDGMAAYICGDEYFSDPAQLFAAGRTEASPDLARQLQYRLPDRVVLDKQLRVDVPLPVWLGLEERFPANPLAAFKYFCLQDDVELGAAIVGALDQIMARGGCTEAIITCVNCATLQRLCHTRNLPLIHLELGPLRRPFFLQTAYFDFNGVNGGTEAQCRFENDHEVVSTSDRWNSIEDLRSLFMSQHIQVPSQADIDLGLGLQVEDDSNVVCYANGHSALSLINDGRRSLAEGGIMAPPILVRPHPGSFFSLRHLPVGLEIDTSETSVDFVVRCRRILSINSGLAVESLLLGRAALMRGESPFGYCVSRDTGECRVPEFAFFLLNYLVPWHLAFQTGYIRWRLGKPTEKEIQQRHLEGFMQEKIRLLELRVSELECSLRESEERLARIKSSFAWRLLWPLRALSRFFYKVLRDIRCK